MPIEINPSCTVVTGDSIQFYRLLQLRSALKLEMIGLKHSRGFSAYATIKREFGLKGNKACVLEQFEAIVNAESAKQERIVKP